MPTIVARTAPSRPAPSRPPRTAAASIGLHLLTFVVTYAIAAPASFFGLFLLTWGVHGSTTGRVQALAASALACVALPHVVLAASQSRRPDVTEGAVALEVALTLAAVLPAVVVAARFVGAS